MGGAYQGLGRLAEWDFCGRERMSRESKAITCKSFHCSINYRFMATICVSFTQDKITNVVTLRQGVYGDSGQPLAATDTVLHLYIECISMVFDWSVL